ncbi:hypothetical protein HNR02_003881 [Amycolatopsis endophytica]|uniref:Uncharacterized protein n=1 Tax=Amycolatopsis endophytica TaxID=860233 RepID=A0A853B5Q3_9PSEU|nr:hypothetical protein [Amycolatopsis endophytica]
MPATEPITDTLIANDEDTTPETVLVDDESHLIRGYD